MVESDTEGAAGDEDGRVVGEKGVGQDAREAAGGAVARGYMCGGHFDARTRKQGLPYCR